MNYLQKIIKFTNFSMLISEKLINWTFKHVHAFSFSNLNTPFILLKKEKFTYIMWASHLGKNGNKLSIHSWLTTSTSIPECGPTDYRTLLLLFLPVLFLFSGFLLLNIPYSLCSKSQGIEPCEVWNLKHVCAFVCLIAPNSSNTRN